MRTTIITALVAGVVTLAGCGGGPAGHAPAHPTGQSAPQAPAVEQVTADDEDTTEAALRARYEAAKRKLEALLASGTATTGTNSELAMAVTEFVENAIAYYVCQGCTGEVAPLDPAVISRSAVRGTTAADLIDYLKDMADGGPWGPAGSTWQRWPQLPLWTDRPTVRVWSNATADQHRMTAKAVDMINDWLPVEHRMVMGAPTALRTDFELDVPAGEIHVSFDYDGDGGQSRYHESCCNLHTDDVPYMISNLVLIDPNASWHNTFGLIVHELVHAMGIPGHVFEGRHPTSLMPDGAYRDGPLPDEADLPDLPRLDGEALMTAYALYDDGETDRDINYASLGAWAQTIPVISGEISTTGGDVSFGAEYRQQWTRAWDEGPVPATTLAASSLRGTATWTGAMVGYTDRGQETTGDAGIEVNLSSMRGSAEFTDIEADGSPWAFGRDLSTRIAVSGNHIESTQGGPWVGFDAQFRGSGHEAVTGAFRWERLDTGNLTAAFGAHRDQPTPPPEPEPTLEPVSGVGSISKVGGHIQTGTEQYDEYSIDHIGRFSGTRDTWSFNGWGLWGIYNGDIAFTAQISGVNIANGLSTALFDPYYTSITGIRSFDNPTGNGRAVWRGNVLAYETHPDTFGTPVEGDARVEMNLDSSLDFADVYFTNFTKGHANMSWHSLSVFSGRFSRFVDEIAGNFYGDGHEGVAGTFERDSLKGIFGAMRE